MSWRSRMCQQLCVRAGLGLCGCSGAQGLLDRSGAHTTPPLCNHTQVSDREDNNEDKDEQQPQPSPPPPPPPPPPVPSQPPPPQPMPPVHALRVGHEKGERGTLALTAAELQWRAMTATAPLCAALSTISFVATEWKQLTPFSGVSELRLRASGLDEPLAFHVDGPFETLNENLVIFAHKTPNFPCGALPRTPPGLTPWTHGKVTFHCTSYFRCTFSEHDCGILTDINTDSSCSWRIGPADWGRPGAWRAGGW